MHAPRLAEIPQPHLRTRDAVAMLFGMVVGSGIFALPALVAANSPGPGAMLGLWLGGGLIGILGALCYAELAAAYPNSGGDYHFLRRAYGPEVGFLFAWGRLTVIQTGALAAAAFIGGDYLSEIAPLGGNSSAIYAAAMIVGLTVLNLAGLQAAKWTQNALAVTIGLGLVTVAASGFWLGVSGNEAPVAEISANGGNGAGALGLALVFVLFTFGGWNEAAYLAPEIRDPNRNVPRVLLLGIGLITGLYLLVNLALLAGLGFSGMAASSAVAADLLRRVWGEPGAIFIGLLVVVAVLSTVNATIVTGARSNYALGRDFGGVFRFLGTWRSGTSVPVAALLIQSGIALALIGVVPLWWEEDGLEAMVAYTAPVFWFFFFLVGLSVVVLRWWDPERPRPFRVPLFPLVPFGFCCVCLYMLYSSIAYAGTGSLLGVAIVFAGIPFLVAWRRGRSMTAPNPEMHHPS